jgi:hypothetical protein
LRHRRLAQTAHYIEAPLSYHPAIVGSLPAAINAKLGKGC